MLERILRGIVGRQRANARPDIERVLRAELVEVFGQVGAGMSSVSRTSDDGSVLRIAVRQFATSRRTAGVTPEHALIDFKRIVRDVNPILSADRPVSDHDALREFNDRLVSWCIEDYFHAD